MVRGAASAPPAQAGVVEEAEVAPQGEVITVAPAAADHLRHCRLSRLPSHLGRLISRFVPGQHLVGHPARGALSDEVQIGPHPIPGRRPLRQGVVGPLSALGELVGRTPLNSGVKARCPTVGVSESVPGTRWQSELITSLSMCSCGEQR